MSHPPPSPHPPIRRIAIALLVACCAGLAACKKKPSPATNPPADTQAASAPSADSTRSPALARARLALAREAVEDHRPDHALAWLAASVEADRSPADPWELAIELIRETRWHLPATSFDPKLRIHHLAAHGDSLWITLDRWETPKDDRSLQTVIRWDLATSSVAAVLFPTFDASSAGLTLSPKGSFVVVSRQLTPNTIHLLCRADTLTPIIDLGPGLIWGSTESLITFSEDDLLIAHPEQSEEDGPIRWHIRDAASGQTLRTEENLPPALAAHLSSRQLTLLATNGTYIEVPVSPVEAVRQLPAPVLTEVQHARFFPDAQSLILIPKNLVAGLRHSKIATTENAVEWSDHPDELSLDALHALHPWSQRSPLWAALANQPTRLAPFPDRKATLTATALTDRHRFFATEDHTVSIHQWLPPITLGESALSPNTAALTKLSRALTGLEIDPETEYPRPIPLEARIDAAKSLTAADLNILGLSSPQFLEFAQSLNPTSSNRPNLTPLWKRLSLADNSGLLWPQILRWSDGVDFERWHQDLHEAVLIGQGSITANPDAENPSPWRIKYRLKHLFESNDRPAIESAISNLDGDPIPASLALLEATLRGESTWIQSILDRSPSLPTTLKTAATARLLWSQGRKRDAIALWPDPPPDYQAIRTREDWLGWELADFSPLFNSIQADIQRELEGLSLPPDASPEIRAELAERLLDPAIETIVGRQRLADITIRAAIAYADFPEESKTTFQLANLARRLGAPAAPCLRAEALALTSMADFTEAHPRWIILLTEHPVTSHLPTDYSEAAYTAFETGDPRQAVEILATGIKRFPANVDFALRAGWIALLTGNPDRAYEFLITALDIGIPETQLERANALLSIAAYQAEFVDDAFIHYANLLALDPSWADDEAIDALAWPDELKATLFQLAWQP